MTIELAPHQIAAVARARELLRDRGGVILADEPGLGKSFVAAAVARDFDSECIVPAGLIEQWRTTLDAFGVNAPITTPDRIINEPCMPGTKAGRLIIVDEAHAFRNPQTQRYAALARRSIGARLMLVTATPICNSPDDLHALVALIARDDSLRAEGVPSVEEAFRLRRADEIAIVMRELMIRRGSDVLDRFATLDRQIIRHHVPDAPIDTLRFPLIGGHASLLRGVLWRRLESSEAALLESVKRQTRFYERALDSLASGHTLTKRDYRSAFGDEDADALQEVLFWEVFATEGTRVEAEEIRAELARLDTLRKFVDTAPRTKSVQLAEICTSSAEPMLIFTSAIATASDVHASIPRRAGVVTSHGATPVNAIAAFNAGTLDALVCTDLAAEGLNLQRAGMVVHYDLPWNPVKIDQRNGRAARIGQMRDVVKAIYFLPRGGRTHVARTIAAKNRVRHRILSGAPLSSAASSLTLLPSHLPRTAPAVALLTALQRRGLHPPAGVAARHRAGIERLFSEMAGEYLDNRRVSDLTDLLERERIIESGTPCGSSNR